MTDFIAVCRFTSGGGSWAREADPEKAIAECARIVKADWGSTFKLTTVKIGLYNAEGFDTVTMGLDGVWGGPDGDQALPFVEVREVTL